MDSFQVNMEASGVTGENLLNLDSDIHQQAGLLRAWPLSQFSQEPLNTPLTTDKRKHPRESDAPFPGGSG